MSAQGIQQSEQDDGLILPEVGDYSERKYSLAAYYAGLFSTSMKPPKWDCLVYIDLFSGAGKARCRDNNKIIPGTPLLALRVKHPFHYYIFCEKDGKKFEALQQRVAKEKSSSKIFFINGDSNLAVSEILSYIPRPSKHCKVLSFCIADPFCMDNLKFSTLRELSKIFVDFLVLIPHYMDAHRNAEHYCGLNNSTVAEFLGNPDWRNEWDCKNEVKFGHFIATQFCESMHRIGYKGSIEDTVLIKRPQNNVPLYRLAFFSQNDLGLKFWREAKKQTNDQLEFNLCQ